MELVNNESFLQWAAERGIAFDERYPEARSLGFIAQSDHARFWTLPRDNPAAWRHFADSILSGLDPWSFGFLWPRPGKWQDAQPDAGFYDLVRAISLRGTGIPAGQEGAACFDLAEEEVLLAAIFVYGLVPLSVEIRGGWSG